MTDTLNVRNEGIEDFYDIGQEIGSGQFAVVKKLFEKSSGKEFAAKFMKKKRFKSVRRGMTSEQILREANVLRSINHKGIIYLHDIFETKLEFVLVLELLSGGELFEFLSEQEYLTEDEAVGFLKQVIEAIEYIHGKSIVHLDIKPENIVLKTKGSTQIKLIDFGLAREMAKGEMIREIMGTPEFVAPEIIAFEPVGTETDMWAVGVLTYIMLSGASPFLGDNDTETFNNISHVDYEFDDEYFKDISSPAKEFISDLLAMNPRDRMNAGECLKHEWMQDQNSSGESEEDDDVDNLPATKSDKQKGEGKSRRSTLIKTEAFKKFTARARWQKSVNKLIAISRFALLAKKNGPLTKGVLLQPNESDPSSDTESTSESQSIPLDRLDDSDRESTAESTNEEESLCSTDSARAANEEASEGITTATKNGLENERKDLLDEDNEPLNEDEKEINDEITPTESKTRSRSESSEKVTDSLDGEKTLDYENQSEVPGFSHLNGKSEKEQEKPEWQEKKPVLPAAQPVLKSSVEEKVVLPEEKPVMPEVKPVQPVSKTSLKEKPDLQEEKPVLPVAEPVRRVSKSPDVMIESSAKQSPTEPKFEVKNGKRLSDKNTDNVFQKSSQIKSKNNNIRTERNQEDTKSKSKLLFHGKNKEDKAAKKSEPTKMKAGKFESLLSKFSKSHATNEEDSKKKNTYAKEARRLTSGSVNKIKNEGFEDPRTRRKSDQMVSRIDWQAIRAGRDERLKTEPLKTNIRTQHSEGLARTSQSYRERSGRDKALARNTTSKGKAERSKSPALEKSSATERTITTSITKTEIRKTTSPKPFDDGGFTNKPSAKEKVISTSVTKTEVRKTTSPKPSFNGDSSNKQNEPSVWVRRATTSQIEGKKDFRNNRRGILGLSHTSAKAEVMKWEQRQNNGADSSPRRPRSSPLKPVTDRQLLRERQEADTQVHNTTVTVNTKDTRKVPPVEMGAAVKDKEHTLLVQTSLPTQETVHAGSEVSGKRRDSDTKVKAEESKVKRSEKHENGKRLVENAGKVSEKRRDSDTKVKTEESKVKRSGKHENGKPLVENAGKHRKVVENPQHKPRETENKSSKHKKDKEKSEVKTEIQSGSSSFFPAFDLTFQKILPALNDGDLPAEDDELVWVMTSETNPNLEFFTTGMAAASPKKSKSNSKEPRRKTTRSSETDTEFSVHVVSGGRRRSTESSEADTEPSFHVVSGGRLRSTISEEDTEPSVNVDSGSRRRSTKSSETETAPSVYLDSGSRRRSERSSKTETESSVHMDSGSRRRSERSSKTETEPSVFENSGIEVENEPAVFESSRSEIEIKPKVRLSSVNTKLELVDNGASSETSVTTIPLASGVTTVNFEINTSGLKRK